MAWWSLRQTLAWIKCRDLQFVETADPVELLGELAREFIGHSTRPRAELLDALEAERLTARGRRNGQGSRIDTPSSEWPGLRFYFDPDIAAPARFLGRHAFGKPAWSDLVFHSDVVRHVWSMPPPQVAEVSFPDPFSVSRWTLAQAVCWISCRTVDAVVHISRQAAEAKEGVSHSMTRRIRVPGHKPREAIVDVRTERPTSIDINGLRDCQGRLGPSARRAEEELLERLSRGAIIAAVRPAVAIECAGGAGRAMVRDLGDVVQPSPEEWDGRHFEWDTSERYWRYQPPCAIYDGGGTTWGALMFSRDDVMREWPLAEVEEKRSCSDDGPPDDLEEIERRSWKYQPPGNLDRLPPTAKTCTLLAVWVVNHPEIFGDLTNAPKADIAKAIKSTEHPTVRTKDVGTIERHLRLPEGHKHKRYR